MPVDYSDATAIVLMTGLGIVGISEERKRSETLLIHNPEHSPKLRILKPAWKATTPIVDIPIVGHEVWIDHSDLPTRGVNREGQFAEPLRISVTGIGNSEFNGIERHLGVTFDRRSEAKNDPHDWRWVPDLERDDLLGDGSKKRQPSDSATDTSRVFLQNCLMFSHDLVTNDEKRSVKQALTTKFLRRTIRKDMKKGVKILDDDYGPVTDYVGAKFRSDFVRIEINAGSYGFTHILPKAEKPYYILVTNALRVDTTKSDMPVYQTFWDVDDPTMTDLEILSELEKTYKKYGLPFTRDRGGSSHGVRRTCNLIAAENGLDGFV